MQHEDRVDPERQDLKGRALKMADMVAYQQGAVVSRTVIDRKVGTVTLFAFDKGQGLSEHTAPYDALVCILDGEARVTISGKAVKIKTGEMIVMPANELHALDATAAFKMMLVMIRS